jgi:probable rRNA maturation factor
VIEIEINDQQAVFPVDRRRWKRVARTILKDQGITAATISLAVVSDQVMRQLNRRYLAHDYPTDVLSFVLERTGAGLEGEVIVNAEMAAASAPQYHHTPQDELLVYVIHGLLHLVGLDDQDSRDRAVMRAHERYYLAQDNLGPRRRAKSMSRKPARAPANVSAGKGESGT